MSIRRRSSLLESFNDAFEGVIHVLRTQRNLRIHFVIAAGVPRQLGDVVLCPEVVRDEWRPALVHGLLHLLGYDHGAEMEAREETLR